MEGRVDYYDLTLVLSTLVHFDPFQAIGSGELGFLWITEVLNSGYQEDQCEQLAREVVKLLGRHFFCESSVSFIDMQSAWIPPLLVFLSLSQRFNSAGSMGFIALHILVTSLGHQFQPNNSTHSHIITTPNLSSTSMLASFEHFPEVQVWMVLLADGECFKQGSQWTCSSCC